MTADCMGIVSSQFCSFSRFDDDGVSHLTTDCSGKWPQKIKFPSD